MKLTYQINETTALQPDILHDKIIHLLTEKKYKIISYNNGIIEFDNSLRTTIPRSEGLGKLSKGVFTIINSGNMVEVKLIYFISYLEETILIAALFACALIFDYYISFLIVFIIIAFVIKIMAMKNVVSRKLMKDVII